MAVLAEAMNDVLASEVRPVVAAAAAVESVMLKPTMSPEHFVLLLTAISLPD